MGKKVYDIFQWYYANTEFFGGVKVLFLANFGRTAVKFASKMCPLSSQVKKKFLLLKVYRIEKYATFSDVLDSGTPGTTLASRQLYQAFICENSPCRQNQSWPCMIIHKLYQIIKCQVSLFLWDFLGHSFKEDFAELIFTCLIRICALNPKSRHYVTLATPRVVPVNRRAKALKWKKVVPLACHVYPVFQDETIRNPSFLAPREGFANSESKSDES